MGWPKIPKKKHAEILAYRDKPVSLRQIGRECGVHHTTVLHVFEDAGIVPYGARKSKELTERIKKESVKGGSFREISARAGCSPDHSRRVIKGGTTIIDEEPEEGLPDPVQMNFDPYVIDSSGCWGIINDIHIPCHDTTTLNLFVKECRRRAVRGVILNGDLLDSHEISVHDKDPSMPRYKHEIEQGREFVQWLRKSLPRARIIFKHGNHEERLRKYIFDRAPALEGLEGVNLAAWLHLTECGIDDIPDKRVIHLGKLHVLHGHEYRGGGGVNPARWLFLRARSVAVCGHFHRTSEHHERNIAMKFEAAWSIGCACYLHPQYAPINSWNHGFAFCEVANDGSFAFENKRIFDGKVV